MIKFNQLSKVAAVVILLTSCVKADKHAETNADGPSSFRLSKSGELVSVAGYARNQLSSNDIELRSSRNVSVISKFANYTNQREYEFKMCGLQDTRSQNPVLGLKFDIFSELDIRTKDGSRTAVIEADGGGNCIYWTATIPFMITAKSVNLEINFIFKTTGSAAKNYIHRKVLLNPWDSRRGENPEFLDFTNSGLSPKLNDMEWARGIDDIDAALAGRYRESVQRLEIGSVNIVPVQKNKQNLIETNLIGAGVEEDRNQKVVNEQLRLKLNGGQKLQTLDLHLNILLDNLKIRLKDSAGVNSDMALTTGRYRIFAQLIATDVNTKGHYILTDKLLLNEETTWTTNTMGVNAVLPLSLVIRPQWGNLNLALKVVPVDVPGVEPFEGLYHLGQFNELAGGKSPLFDLSEYTLNKDTNTISFSYDEYIQRANNFKDWEKGLAEQAANQVTTFEKGFRQFMFSTLNVLFSRIMPGDTATDRTIQYTVETCVINTLTGARPGAGLVFDIETEDRGHKFLIRRQTNDLGCLTWVGMISHKVYNRENLVRKVSKLTYIDDVTRKTRMDEHKPHCKDDNNSFCYKNKKDFAVYELDYYINPWDEKFTFGRDSRILPKEYLAEIESQQKIAPPTRVLITDFKYDATGFRYAIDKYMNLTVKKTVLMTIKPKILKYNSIVWGRSGLSELRDGIYLFKIAMQKDYLDPAAPGRQIVFNSQNGQYRVDYNGQNLEKKQYLVVKELLVRVLGGEIVTPIEFDVTDLRTLRIRAQMIIQIETIDEMLLRAVALADTKLNSLINSNGSKKTQEILDLRAQQDVINRRLEELNTAANQEELRQSLLKNKNDIQERLLKALATLDEESLQKTLGLIDSIRATGETNVSVDRNIKYQALNQTLRVMREKIQNEMAKREERVRREYVQSQNEICRQNMNYLLNRAQYETDEEKKKEYLTAAEGFNPATNSTTSGEPGSLCVKDIPQDQIFYHMTTSNDIGAEDWLKTLFTKEEFELYQSNQLRDDFTKPYLPNYDFNLLSNQGDELLNEDGSPRPAKDLYVSGLSRRTFIGPITFVLNGNGSAVRPTDVLDENSCNGTCEQLKEIEFTEANQSDLREEVIKRFGLPVNAAYEDNPYFGYVGHFYKKQVDDFIPMYRALRYQYHQEMNAFSQVGNFLDQLSLNYVSFAKKPEAVKSLDYACYAKWKTENEKVYLKWQSNEDKSFKASPIPAECFSPNQRVVSQQNFLKEVSYRKQGWVKFNDYQYEDPTPEQWVEFSKNGLLAKLSLDVKQAHLHAMCKALRKNFLDAENSEDLRFLRNRYKATKAVSANISGYTSDINNIENQCNKLVYIYFKDVRSDLSANSKLSENEALMGRAKQLPFALDRKVRVYQTSNRYIYKDGQTLNYSVGESFSLSHSKSVDRGYKLDPLETLEKTLGAFDVTKGASQVIGALSGMLNFNWGMGESQSTSDGTSVSVGTNLAAQISTLDIELSSWEKCLTVRFDDTFLRQNVLASRTFFNAKWAVKSLGFFMCSGVKDTKDDLAPANQPLRVREKYYYLTQIFNEGDMQDPGALSNHPWMLHLRGVRDFALFEKALKLPPKEITWTEAWSVMKNDLASLMVAMRDQKHNDRSSLEVISPQDSMKALRMMQEAFERALPTFPGMYTFSESTADNVLGWSADMSKASVQGHRGGK